jgi:hypothetical protein
MPLLDELPPLLLLAWLELELPAVLELEPPEEDESPELLLESPTELLEPLPEGLESPPEQLELLPEGLEPPLEPPEPESLEPPTGLPVIWLSKTISELAIAASSGFIISPLPQAITMATAATAAKASGAKLMNLDFFDINTSENAYQCKYIIFL